jgi:hypothetical protein
LRAGAAGVTVLKEVILEGKTYKRPGRSLQSQLHGKTVPFFG